MDKRPEDLSYLMLCLAMVCAALMLTFGAAAPGVVAAEQPEYWPDEASLLTRVRIDNERAVGWLEQNLTAEQRQAFYQHMLPALSEDEKTAAVERAKRELEYALGADDAAVVAVKQKLDSLRSVDQRADKR
jgi:Spy/CpxP family protein refolding chaperone